MVQAVVNFPFSSHGDINLHPKIGITTTIEMVVGVLLSIPQNINIVSDV